MSRVVAASVWLVLLITPTSFSSSQDVDDNFFQLKLHDQNFVNALPVLRCTCAPPSGARRPTEVTTDSSHKPLIHQPIPHISQLPKSSTISPPTPSKFGAGKKFFGGAFSQIAFTECDYLFDASRPAADNQNEFTIPIIASKFAAATLPSNIQCIYTFIGRKGERVKIDFTDFQLSGTADNCDLEYLDVYSELRQPSDNLLTAVLGGRFCGSVAPHVRISLHSVLILVFHSRIGNRRTESIRISGQYEFIPEERFTPGRRIPGGGDCAFIIESTPKNTRGTIFSPTYPGPYPSNYRCVYLLKGSPGSRIRLHFVDFDIYFGGEHCPYDALTIYDGPTTSASILRKVCGLQQRLEMFSIDSALLLEFNTSFVLKNSARGFAIDYEFSDRFVNARALALGQRGVSHIAGAECDIRILSTRESVHHIVSPNFPNSYPLNTTCTYILDGLQGDQNLEKVIITFEELSLDDSADAKIIPANNNNNSAGDDCTSGSFVGVARTVDSIKTVLSMTEESVYDVILCNRIPKGSADLGPYTSLGPRIVVVFDSADGSETVVPSSDENRTSGRVRGFKALIEFKTDFGVPGEAMGDSNVCMFRFTDKRGSFNSPRYPANYPLDTNCTYFISASPGEEILLYFTQFALFEEDSKSKCNDFLEIYDVFDEPNGKKRYQLQAKHCWTMFPGPTISTFGAHEMRVVFASDSFGTANGFNVRYEIRKSRKLDVPIDPNKDPEHCGQLIETKEGVTTGYFTSPGFPIKYSRNQQCDWEVSAREGYQILLQLTKMDVEGEITEQKTSCMNAVIVIHLDYKNRSADLAICGTNPGVLSPIVTNSNSIRISFLTAPDKVNGLTGFNFTWTEIRLVQSDSECSDDSLYLCSYTRLCIDASLRCNGDDNCGENDDTDEAHCNIGEKSTDMRTILVAATFSGFIFIFIFGFFCFLFKKKLERKKQHKRSKGGSRSSNNATLANKGKTSYSTQEDNLRPLRARSGTQSQRRKPQYRRLSLRKESTTNQRVLTNDGLEKDETGRNNRQPYRCVRSTSTLIAKSPPADTGHASTVTHFLSKMPAIIIRPDSATLISLQNQPPDDGWD